MYNNNDNDDNDNNVFLVNEIIIYKSPLCLSGLMNQAILLIMLIRDLFVRKFAYIILS